MPVPKGKASSTRRDKRRTHYKIEAPNLVECPQCHELMVPHRICKNCGYYNGKNVLNVEEAK